MNELPADLPPALPPGRPPRDRAWSRRKWLWVLVLICAAQAGFLFLFGAKKEPAGRPVSKVPVLQLARAGDEWVALGDPTLFVLPHANGFGAGVWQQPPAVTNQLAKYTEPPQFLALDDGPAGGAAERVRAAERFAGARLDFRPVPALAEPLLARPPAGAGSTLVISGDLAGRRLLGRPVVPVLADDGVLPPSTVQVLVDAAGSVASLVLLPPGSMAEAKGRAMQGDTNALRIARSLRFAPAAAATLGQVRFDWQTVPPGTEGAP